MIDLTTAPATRAPHPLSPREREIATLIADGLTSRAIAKELAISGRTVDAHVEHIRAKLRLHSRTQIAAWAVRVGLSTGSG
jgi:DNA-binding CsgD family transcriptional regulator